MNKAKQKENIDTSIAIIVILMTAILIYFVGFRTEKHFLAPKNEISTLEASFLIEDKTYFLKSDSFLNTDDSSKESIPDNIYYLETEMIITLDSFQHRFVEQTINIQDKNAKVLYFDLKDTIESILPKNSTESYQFNYPKGTTDESLSQEINEGVNRNFEDDCIILIGAFSKKSNVEKLRDTLEEAGYPIFEVVSNKLYKIGVYENCQVDILSQSLQIIRRKYAKDAHVYQSK